MKTGEHKIDLLFRDRLDGMDMEPSAGARERMNRIITEKRNKVIYRRMAVAAGVLIILAGSVLLSRIYFNSGEKTLTDHVQVSSDKKSSDTIRPGSPIPEPRGEEIAVVPLHEKQETEKTLTKERTAVARVNDQSDIKDKQDAADQTSVAEKINVPEMLHRKSLASLDMPGTGKMPSGAAAPDKAASGNNTVQPEPVVIEYIAERHTQNTGREKSTLVTGIVEKAKEIGREVNYGEIRDFKDQLFALDFIKTRKGNNNSK